MPLELSDTALAKALEEYSLDEFKISEEDLDLSLLEEPKEEDIIEELDE